MHFSNPAIISGLTISKNTLFRFSTSWGTRYYDMAWLLNIVYLADVNIVSGYQFLYYFLDKGAYRHNITQILRHSEIINLARDEKLPGINSNVKIADIFSYEIMN